MLSWLRRTYAARRDRRLQARADKKAADAALAANPLLHKRALRRENIIVVRRWTLRAAFAVAVSGATTVQPDLVSASLGDYAAAHGADGLQNNFSTASIRVYDRRNPLVPFHMAGQDVRRHWQGGGGLFYRSATAPVVYSVGLVKGAVTLIFSAPLDAYSISDNAPYAVRQCFIRPAGHLDTAVLFKDFTGVAAKPAVRGGTEESMARYYATLTLAHEARHCDQDKSMGGGGLNEIDADMVADRIAGAGLSPKHHAALRSYWASLRLIHAVADGDVGHYSTPALLRGRTTPLQAIDDTATAWRLMLVLQGGESHNAVALSELGAVERRYHLAVALLADRKAGDARLRGKAQAFVQAVRTLNTASDGKLITVPHKKIAAHIDMAWLRQTYNPMLLPEPQAPGVPSSIAARAGRRF